MKRSYKQQTPAEKAETDRLAALAESEADQAEVDRLIERHERMRDLIGRLKAERERQGLSLAQTAKRISMDRANLHRLETNPNANPTLDTLYRLAEALGKEIHVELHDVEQAA